MDVISEHMKRTPIFISLGFYNKPHRLGRLKPKTFVSSQFFEAGKSSIKVPGVWVLGESSFPAYPWHLLAVPSHSRERERERERERDLVF